MEIASPEFYTLQLELLKTTLDADLLDNEPGDCRR